MNWNIRFCVFFVHYYNLNILIIKLNNRKIININFMQKLPQIELLMGNSSRVMYPKENTGWKADSGRHNLPGLKGILLLALQTVVPCDKLPKQEFCSHFRSWAASGPEIPSTFLTDLTYIDIKPPLFLF